MKMNRLLIVEDNRALALAMSASAERAGFEVVAVPSLALARKDISSCRPDAILLDLGLPDGSGLDLLEVFDDDDLPVVAMVTAHGEIDHAIAAKKLGVADFFVKPVDFSELEVFFKKALESACSVGGGGDFSSKFIGESPLMREVFKQVAKACSSDFPVIVRGREGSGRSHVAHLIHEHGDSEEDCVVVDCSDFTGDWDEVIKGAEGGSVILDGVDDLLLENQSLLEKIVSEKIGIRWIAIVREGGLRDAVKEHSFHPDLYYRLQGGEVVLPSLQERMEDFRELCELFLSEQNSGKPVKVGGDVFDVLVGNTWKGNLRELKRVLRLAVEASEGREVLKLEDFPEEYLKSAVVERVGFEGALENWVEDWFVDRVPEYREIHENLEGMLLEVLLERFEGNQAALARGLDMNRATLRKKLKKS